MKNLHQQLRPGRGMVPALTIRYGSRQMQRIESGQEEQSSCPLSILCIVLTDADYISMSPASCPLII